MGAHLEFTAEAAGEHADYGHTDPVRYNYIDRMAD